MWFDLLLKRVLKDCFLYPEGGCHEVLHALAGELKLPPEQIRLTFTGFRGKASSAKIQTSVKFRRLRSDSNTLVIEIDSKNLGDRPSRIAVKP